VLPPEDPASVRAPPQPVRPRATARAATGRASARVRDVVNGVPFAAGRGSGDSPGPGSGSRDTALCPAVYTSLCP
jgi:hypothetical protein